MSENKNEIMIVDGNEAAADAAYRLSELAIIYPITPSSPMGEHSDVWSAQGRENIFGFTPEVAMMQSEAGAAGAVHGSLQMGTLATTFTASQGLLLMIPNMYKIAGELSPFVMHVAARSVATHALSIFGDHSDVMACRQTGFAILASNSPQEAHDMAIISHAATLKSRVPFLHFFDGFDTSHELQKIERVSNDVLKKLIDIDAIKEKKDRALRPEKPGIRGTAQNPDVFFQAREASNPYYFETIDIVKDAMAAFGKAVGREYGIVEYIGAKDAEKVIVMMGSSAETAEETVEYLSSKGEKIGLVKIRLYRPFPTEDFVNILPKTVKKIAVLDRTKESGSVGEPLYLDVAAALKEQNKSDISVFGGRYGLSSKEFNPACVKAVFDELSQENPKKEFTVGINDDLTKLSLEIDERFTIFDDVNNLKEINNGGQEKGLHSVSNGRDELVDEMDDLSDNTSIRLLFFGLGADGTVGANKNTIKVIAGMHDWYAQGQFKYDSKKSGTVTTSHLRFSKNPIKSHYLIHTADFIACHHFPVFYKQDILSKAKKDGILLINSPFPKDKLWDNLPFEVQKTILDKNLKVYGIDAAALSAEIGLGRKINTIMQTCFFKLADEYLGLIKLSEAEDIIKKAIEKTYGRKGDDVVKKNFEAVDRAIDKLYKLETTGLEVKGQPMPPIVANDAPDHVKNITAQMLKGEGDKLPVSSFTPDGSWPSATTKYEKRKIANEIPIWDPDTCIQCGKCSFVCPHAAIRTKVIKKSELKDMPNTFKVADYKGKEFGDEEYVYVVQTAPEDCTGCTLCTQACPAKNKDNPEFKAINMKPLNEHIEDEKQNFEFFLNAPNPDRSKLNPLIPKHTQLMEPLFEFSGACAGCGEAAYVKLITQLFGDQMVIANATGCSSIYGGNLPSHPYSVNELGLGPAWSNSLFEDNAEYGYGMKLATDKFKDIAIHFLKEFSNDIGENLVNDILNINPKDKKNPIQQRELVSALKAKTDSLIKSADADKKTKLVFLKENADYLINKSLWIVGGDGWAYDIGYGGLDHVLHMRRDVNILVLDTETYSNTGGQQSKATPIGASAKFASSGRPIPKKDLGIIAMMSNNAYVAQIAMGANEAQTLKAINEAESYNGPSLIIAYSPCISHGIDMSNGLTQQKMAVDSAYWPLYRFDPRRIEQGEAPLKLDSSLDPKISIRDYMLNETRYKAVKKQYPDRFERLTKEAEKILEYKIKLYKHLAEFK